MSRLYDERCLDLAKVFVKGDQAQKELAGDLQDFIEDWLEINGSDDDEEQS